MNTLTREITFRNSYAAPESYGSITVLFKLSGKAGVIVFETRATFLINTCLEPMAMELGAHSYLPRNEHDTPMKSCDFLDGKPCYYDGSSLQAKELLEKFCRTGNVEIIWDKLEEHYKYHLKDLEIGDAGI